MIRIDVESAQKIRTAIELSRIRGVDIVTVLDQGRLLRHMGTRREDAILVLEHAIQVINTMTADHKVKTPMDMRNMIVEKLKEIQNGILGQAPADH